MLGSPSRGTAPFGLSGGGDVGDIMLDVQTRAAGMSRVWMCVGGRFQDRDDVGRRAWVLILFIGVPGLSLVVFIDIHYELETSHDGREVFLKLEVRRKIPS